MSSFFFGRNMGFNTTVVVLNDALHAIENDPEFGKKLAQAIMGFPVKQGISALNHINAASVIETHHADEMVLVAVGGNIGRSLGHTGTSYRDTDLGLIRSAARKLGYDLRKKPARSR